MADRGLRILMLVTDAHGGFGGIAQYNKDVIDALNGLAQVDEIVVLPRVVHEPGFRAPRKATYDGTSARGRLCYLLSAARRAVWGGRFDLIYCAHINLLPVAQIVARLRRLPVMLAIYGIDAWQAPDGPIRRRSISAADLVVSISQVTFDRFAAWSGVDQTRAAILPNAIRMNDFGLAPKNRELARRLGVDGRTVILTFGRMPEQERYKGFDEVIDAMPRLLERVPDLVYVAAGGGKDLARLQDRARAIGVSDRVVFTGRICEAEKADLYRLADAYVMPSSGEGFGFVVLEALACGVPVVASRTDGTREAVRGGELGLLVDPSDQDELVEAVVAALAKPKAIPAGLGYFSEANFAGRLEAALGRLLPSGPAG